MRERRYFWSSKPGKAFLLSITGTIIAFVLLGIYGVIEPALGLEKVLFTLGFSVFFSLALVDPVKRLVFSNIRVYNMVRTPSLNLVLVINSCSHATVMNNSSSIYRSW